MWKIKEKLFGDTILLVSIDIAYSYEKYKFNGKRSFVAYVIYSMKFRMEFLYNKINCREKLNPSMEHDFVFILFLTYLREVFFC